MNANLRDKLRAIFNKHDPIGIYFGRNVNFDEYDPEIEQLLELFNKSKNEKEFRAHLHALFKRMFFPDITGTIGRYSKLSREVYSLLKN